MKASKKFFTVLGLGLAVFFSGINQASASSVLLASSSPQVKVGDIFTVDVIFSSALAGVNTADELLAFGLETLTTTQLLFVASSVTSNFQNDSALLGLDAAGSAFPGISIDASTPNFTLATLSYQAVSEGLASIGVNSNLTDLNQGLIFLNQGQIDLNGSLSLTVTAVPVPAALLLFLSGLGVTGLGSIRSIKSSKK